LAADGSDHPEHNRVQLKMLVGIDMVEGETGALKQVELRHDFREELTACISARYEFESQSDHVAPEIAIGARQPCDLLEAKSGPPFEENQVETDAKLRHCSCAPHGIARPPVPQP
jgi:hypothetical protein